MTESSPKKTAINLKLAIPVVLIILIFVLAQISQVSAFSVRELLGLDKPEEEEQAAGKQKQEKEWAATAEADTNPQLKLRYVKKLVANMNAAEREQILSDPALFKQAIDNEVVNRAVLSAAIANKMDRDSNVEFLMQRGAENILRESYLNRLIASKLPADFPSKQQLQDYYDNNQAQFVVPERVHVWQIFYRKPADADAKSIEAIKQQTSETYKKLTKDKADFAALAVASSEHEQSRQNGGYMGLLKTRDLLPAIKEPLLKLEEGQLSSPVESESGFHILKRGKLMPAETLALEQVQDQIRQLLIQQAQRQLRQAIFTQASKEFPQNLNEEKIEEWRLRLKTNTASN